jgi:alpha-N-arabinofuranosidase
MRVAVPEFTVPVLSGFEKLPGLSGSASIKDRRLAVTLTNPSLEAEVSAVVRLEGGGRVAEAKGVVLTHEDMKATNTFDAPDTVTPAPAAVRVVGDAARVTIPRKAVVALDLLVA